MSFLEDPRFPACPGFGHQSVPNYSVTITETVSGAEHRNRNWARPLHRYSVTVGPQLEEHVDELLEFYHALGGQECGFRYKDIADFKSCRKSETSTVLDQAAELLPGSPGGWQLVKAYRAGVRVQTRVILKPVAGTIVIADNGVQKVEGVDWVMDYTTGIFQVFFVPVGIISWGGEFDVPVRFDSEFPIEAVSERIQSVQFALKELRDPAVED